MIKTVRAVQAGYSWFPCHIEKSTIRSAEHVQEASRGCVIEVHLVWLINHTRCTALVTQQATSVTQQAAQYYLCDTIC